MSDTSNISEKLVEGIENLPPMPANIIKLRRAAADPNMNYDHIIPILKEDPSICADLLRIANSARYGVGHNVDTVEEAVRYFGMPSLAEFLAAACTEKIVKQTFSSVRNLNEYLVHSRKVSMSTAHISKVLKVKQHDREVYSVTGLLHDIGRLVILLVTNEKKYSRELLGLAWEDVHKMVDNENELYGIDHAELGMMICRKWQFPEKIIQGVQRHHRPLISNDLSVDGLIVFLSEIIAVPGIADNVIRKALPKEIMDQLGIEEDALIEAKNTFNSIR